MIIRYWGNPTHKLGKIQRRLAWPLDKDDTLTPRSDFLLCKISKKI